MGCFTFRPRAASRSTSIAQAAQHFVPTYSFDRDIDRHLGEWSRLREYGLCLMYPIYQDEFYESEFSRRKAQDVMDSLDAMCTSLIVRKSQWLNTLLWNKGHIPLRLMRTSTFEMGLVGLILDVPPENIVSTHCNSMPFFSKASADSFTDSVLRRCSQERLLTHGKQFYVQSPLEMARAPSVGFHISHSEVVVVTKPYARVHMGRTKKVTVQGIMHSFNGNSASTVVALEMLRRLKALNPGLEVEPG